VIRFRPKHVRTRLTLLYMSVLAVVLILFWMGTAGLLFWQLRAQLSHYAVQDVETVEGLLFFAPDGSLKLRDDYHNHPESRRVLERFLEVLSPSGAVLFRNERLGSRWLGGALLPGEGIGGYSLRSIRLSDGTRVRLVSRRHSIQNRPTIIRLGYDEEPIWHNVDELLAASVVVLPLTLVLAGFAGYALARRALRPLQTMASRAEAITSERLDERLPVDNPMDEIGQLARVFNTTLARLEHSFNRLRQFTSDASHELRTPLTAMRSVGEVALQEDGSAAEYRDVIGSMLEEVNRLTRLIDSLLTMSRADANAVQFHTTTFPIFEIATESAALLQVLMEEKTQTMLLTGDRRAAVQGDRLFLRQALVNLLHNAVKYSPEGGTIALDVRSTGDGRVLLAITDSGPGIAAEEIEKVFDRFYRVDKSRSRDRGGAGLGLAIAEWAVQAHGGQIQVESTFGKGSTFRVSLPEAAVSAQIPLSR
jgi:heavy metal sensor kinase